MAGEHIGSYRRLVGVRLTQVAQGSWSLDMHHLLSTTGYIHPVTGGRISETEPQKFALPADFEHKATEFRFFLMATSHIAFIYTFNKKFSRFQSTDYLNEEGFF
ncbi:hypothetical protein GOBAR_DD04119 [Gossypium barbadense]|nr:hypothetical protein GOBAR_DD04119 [Gossypium barbadense]